MCTHGNMQFLSKIFQYVILSIKQEGIHYFSLECWGNRIFCFDEKNHGFSRLFGASSAEYLGMHYASGVPIANQL